MDTPETLANNDNIIITGFTYNFMVVPVYQPLLRIIEVIHDRGMDQVGTIC
jgi:hypothetical protein